MTLFDLIAIVVVLLSVLAGVSNGAIREVVGLFAFGLAVVGAVLLLPITGPIARSTVQPTWASSAVAVVAAFLALYIALQIASRFLTARLRDAGLFGRIDQALGGGVGLARAAVVLGAFSLLYRAAIPTEARPDWIERSALLPVADAAGATLQKITPKGVAAAGRLGPSLKTALDSPDQGAGATFGRDPDADPTPPARHRSRLREPADAAPSRGGPRNGLDVVLEKSR